MSQQGKKLRIGDLLIQQGAITEDQLVAALAQQKESGQRLGRTLSDMGFVEEDQMLTILSKQLNIPFVDLGRFDFNADLVKKLPETMARRFRAIILEDQRKDLLVGMTDPMDIFAVDELSRLLGRSIKQAVVRESELLASLDVVYRRTQDIADHAEELEVSLGAASEIFKLDQLSAEGDDAPVVRLLTSIFEDAVQVKASDIHIEPDEDVLRIRQRVDGVLQEQVMKETRVAAALVLRLKLLCGLNISEKRLPQDGRFEMEVKGKKVDVRLSTMPLQFGEAVVMRLLDHSNQMTDLNRIGMPHILLERFQRLIRKPNGLILVTGPTGSGKTSTLYGALRELNTPERKIITSEDPIEYRLPRVNQVQVRSAIGLDFSTVLRVALRQDPDVMLIGEIRDKESAQIALRASMTGHLVLSTLHTSDAVSSATRLVDMGVEGFLVAAALKAVLAQRLIRKNCEYCIEEYEPDQIDLEWVVGRGVKNESGAKTVFKRGKGCSRCNSTGYLGRVGIFEMLEITPQMAAALRDCDTTKLNALANSDSRYVRLHQAAMQYALRGETTIEEVARVAGELEDYDIPVLEAPQQSTLHQTDFPQPVSSGVEFQ
jgi:MSHA biogenesis protein MshE